MSGFVLLWSVLLRCFGAVWGVLDGLGDVRLALLARSLRSVWNEVSMQRVQVVLVDVARCVRCAEPIVRVFGHFGWVRVGIPWFVVAATVPIWVGVVL